MKKSAVILLLLAFTLLINGCSDTNKKAKTATDEEYNYITDSQMTAMGSDSYNCNVAKSEDGYYSYISKCIYYTDATTLASIPLCFNPNCVHNNSDCNAYIGASFGIAYNDGYIYYSQNGDVKKDRLGVQFYRMKPDGSEKETLWYFDSMVMEWTVHRGYLYYVYNVYDDSLSNISNSTNCDVYLYRQSLSETRLNPEKIYYAEEVYKGASITCPVGIGNNLYFFVDGFSRDDSKIYVNNYMRLDLIALDSRCMQLGDGRSMFYPTLLGEGLVFQTTRKADKNIDYYITDFNGENPQLLMTVGENERVFTDGTYIYVDNKVEVNLGQDSIRRFKVYSSNLEAVDSVYCDISESSYSRLWCVDDKAFIFTEKTDNGDSKISVFDKSELGSVNGKWDRKICYNSSEISDMSNAPGALSDSAPYGSDTLVELWQKAKDKKYGVKDSFQADEAVVEGGFSVRLIWEQDGGTYTAYFPFMEFESEEKATEFAKDNPYTLQNGSIVVNVGVESIPREVYDMLSSILDGSPIDPISDKEFSLEMYEFAH